MDIYGIMRLFNGQKGTKIEEIKGSKMKNHW